jgi:hypothetical protein
MHRIVNYRIIEELGTISEGMQNAKRLNVIQWADNPTRLDFRIWVKTEEGERPGKGITLTDEEAKRLAAFLNAYLETLEE